jgi:excisionase family DNA binding protein
MRRNLTPVFIRLPKEQAAALDRVAAESGRAKQNVVSDLVGRALTQLASRPVAMGRVEVSGPADTRADEVLTLAEAASLLRLPEAAVRQRAEEGDLPARRFGDEWRFSRLAVLAWLAAGDEPKDRRRR